MHFGENQLSPGSLGISPLPTGHPSGLQPDGFGPPRACSARFTLPMGSSPGFGSAAARLLAYPRRPFGLAFAPAPAVPALASPRRSHSSAHSTKGTPSPRSSPGSDRPEAHGFRRSFTPLAGVLFTVPSRYWFPIGRLRYLALGGGPPRFPPDSACPAVLTQSAPPGPPRRRLRGSHPLRPPVPAAFG